MADIDTAIDYLMDTLISDVTGISLAPADPPESAPDFPLALAIPLRGTIESANRNRSLNLPTIRLAVHVSRGQGLAAAVAQAKPFIDRIGDKLLNADNLTWGGNIDTIRVDQDVPISWEFAPSKMGNVETYAWFFDITIKYHRSIA